MPETTCAIHNAPVIDRHCEQCDDRLIAVNATLNLLSVTVDRLVLELNTLQDPARLIDTGTEYTMHAIEVIGGAAWALTAATAALAGSHPEDGDPDHQNATEIRNCLLNGDAIEATYASWPTT